MSEKEKGIQYFDEVPEGWSVDFYAPLRVSNGLMLVHNRRPRFPKDGLPGRRSGKVPLEVGQAWLESDEGKEMKAKADARKREAEEGKQ